MHNGIIENHDELRSELTEAGYQFLSATDTEVIAHLVHHFLKTERNLAQRSTKDYCPLRGGLCPGRYC